MRRALSWAVKLREQFFDPCLIDSNGAGGYHLITLLDGEYPLADVFDFVSELRDDWANYGLPRKPEVFPPKRAVGPDDLPYALRLVGRHHTNLHYARIWDFDSMGENDWLEGSDAIEALLALRTAPLPKSKAKKQKKMDETAKPVVNKQKPRVCVDLDGVLAKYEGWKGSQHIGTPLPGALEFAWELAKFAEIIVFTSRCSQDSLSDGVSTGQARIAVIDWLEKYKFPFTDVYVGQGKPKVAAFIDDRGVACRPQEDPDAYASALDVTREMIKPRKSTTPSVKRSKKA